MSQNEQPQPTPSQMLTARFENVKIVLAVAERLLLNDYERQVIIQSCLLAAQGLQDEYKRLNETADPVDSDSEEAADTGAEEA
jgi:hypothetical protein